MSASSQAQQLLREGRIAEGERLYEQILLASPHDVEALNVLALAALRRREPARALPLLVRAVDAHPTDFHSRYHRGRAYDESGDMARAAADYSGALAFRPGFFTARLYLAHALERGADSGRPGAREEILKEYVRALGEAQRDGRWLDRATTPPNLQPLVERAVVLIRDTKRAIADDVLSGLRTKYGESELKRVAQALRIYLREEAPQFPDARQRPTFFFFPGLPPSAYLDRKLFPWIGGLEQQTDAIRDELSKLLPSSVGRERVFLNEAVEQANLRGVDVGTGVPAAPSWNGYYFYRHGGRREENCAACPITAAVLDSLPLSRVPGHGPEVLYSVFTPGTHLLAHRGVTNTRLVGHLPLIVPRDCALRVGGEEHAWQEGRAVVFDDTYEHEAWNRSDRIRVVLIFDIWNPYLTDVERPAVAELIARMGAVQPVHD